jgi:hypothetical protein
LLTDARIGFSAGPIESQPASRRPSGDGGARRDASRIDAGGMRERMGLTGLDFMYQAI